MIQPKVTNEGVETDTWTDPGNRQWEVRWRDLAGRVDTRSRSREREK